MAGRKRARDYGLATWRLSSGPLGAITDVPGVRVGHSTVIRGERMRTGATAIFAHDGDPFHERVFAGVDVLNGDTVNTGQAIIDEWGLLCSPVVFASTRSLGVAYEAVVQHFISRYPEASADGNLIPVVMECDDNYLSDNRSFPLQVEDVLACLQSAQGGPVEEGGVGAGTGMQLFGWKGGIGTASRVVTAYGQTYTIGVILNTNFGQRQQLLLRGFPIGEHLADPLAGRSPEGSCVGVLATDAPLGPSQLRRMAKRVGFGLVRCGSVGNDGSGEAFIAFSTAHRVRRDHSSPVTVQRLIEGQFWQRGSPIDLLFEAATEASEEACLNALVAGTTTTGRDGHALHGFPVEEALGVLRQNAL
ncbi:MAG: P1 family peptidase [Thermaerobacter sp.]|nr:P1 family peptidase [Thermaerobacter sp.]